MDPNYLTNFLSLSTASFSSLTVSCTVTVLSVLHLLLPAEPQPAPGSRVCRLSSQTTSHQGTNCTGSLETPRDFKQRSAVVDSDSNETILGIDLRLKWAERKLDSGRRVRNN